MKGFTDKKATDQRATELERRAERVRCGLSDPAEEHARRPLADHLTDYAAALEAKDDTPDHIRLTLGRVRSLLTGCGFAFAADVDAGRAAEG